MFRRFVGQCCEDVIENIRETDKTIAECERMLAVEKERVDIMYGVFCADCKHFNFGNGQRNDVLCKDSKCLLFRFMSYSHLTDTVKDMVIDALVRKAYP